jgi:hypothetical protein
MIESRTYRTLSLSAAAAAAAALAAAASSSYWHGSCSEALSLQVKFKKRGEGFNGNITEILHSLSSKNGTELLVTVQL